MNTSVIILSAGFSSRIGSHKAFLMWDEKQTIIEKLIAEYISFGINEIIIVLNQLFLENYTRSNFNFLEKCIAVTNNYPEYGRFYSILLGCKALTSNQSVFLQNVDNPFTTIKLLKSLFNSQQPEKDIYIPSFQNQNGHPILLSENVIKDLCLINKHDEDLNIRDFIENYNTKLVNWSNEKILVNINTLEEYKKYFSNEN